MITMSEENEAPEQNNFYYQLKDVTLKFEDVRIPKSLYEPRPNKHATKNPNYKTSHKIKINSPPRGFKIDKQNGNCCLRLYKKCYGKDVTCISDSKKYEGCEVYQKYKAKHPKKNNHNHVNSTNLESQV